MRTLRRGLDRVDREANKENALRERGQLERKDKGPGVEHASPELRKKLVNARSSYRTLQTKHTRALQELKDAKVKRMIKEAIERNEVTHLQEQLRQRTEYLSSRDRDLVQKQKLITNLKSRIGTLTRAARRRDEYASLDGSLLWESRIESPSPRKQPESCQSGTQVTPEPRVAKHAGHDTKGLPGAVDRLQQEARMRRQRPVPVVAIEGSPPDVAATPFSQLSVENVVDCANNKLESLLAQGQEMLCRVDPHLSMLSETVCTELGASLLGNDDKALSPAHMIPFLEKTSNDLRAAEEEVQRLDSDLATYEELQLTRAEEALEEHSTQLAQEVRELSREMRYGFEEPREARSRASPRLSVPQSARSLTPPASYVESRTRVPPRPGQPGVMSGQNGQMMVKVGEYITERWVVVGDGVPQYEGPTVYAPQQPTVYAPQQPTVYAPQQPHDACAGMYPAQYA